MLRLDDNDLPLKGVTVLEFAQFLAGPLSGLRLSDLGARVIKVEPPVVGDGSRIRLVLEDMVKDDSTFMFFAANRGKESLEIDLKSDEGIKIVKELLLKVDVLLHNFREGVMEGLGLGYKEVSLLNPKLIYAWVNGYGINNSRSHLPGVDVLSQSFAGLGFLRGEDWPVLYPSAVNDINSSSQLTIGILSLLFRRSNTGKGGYVVTSLTDGAVDLHFEIMSHLLNKTKSPLVESTVRNQAHPLVSAPCGIFKTSDSFLALGFYPINILFTSLNLSIEGFESRESWWVKRYEIFDILQRELEVNSTSYWFNFFNERDIWCSEVNKSEEFINSEYFLEGEFSHEIDGANLLRSPIIIDGKYLFNGKPAPKLGEDNDKILNNL